MEERSHDEIADDLEDSGEAQFVGDLPRKGAFRSNWYKLLEPLLTKQRGWYLVKVLETPEQAWGAQANLTSRMIKIPDPTGNWRFSSRGSNVYAHYDGPAIPAPPRITRASAKRRRKRREETAT